MQMEGGEPGGVAGLVRPGRGEDGTGNPKVPLTTVDY